MRGITTMLVVLGLGCEGGMMLSGDDAVLTCTGNPAPECDDGDPCTLDLCNDALPCGHDECADGEDPVVCFHLPLDFDSDGSACP